MTEHTERNNGGYAFPARNELDHDMDVFVVGEQPGMFLRDWFAGQAISGMLAYAGQAIEPHHHAANAYQMADAMLAKRAKDRT